MKNSKIKNQKTAGAASRPILIFDFAPKACRVALLIFNFSFLIFHCVAGPEASENQVKAAFLLNFPKYVDWPAESFVQTNSPIIVTILGDDGLAADFQKMITGKTINGRPLILKNLPASAEITNIYWPTPPSGLVDGGKLMVDSLNPTTNNHQPSTTEGAKSCHILFISVTARRTAELLPQLHGHSILTVSDDDDFLDQGGAIRFARRDRKIRLEVNLTAANESGLKISSKLLSVADKVRQ